MFEKVNPQHPDKVADRIAGAIVDLCYTKSEWQKVDPQDAAAASGEDDITEGGAGQGGNQGGGTTGGELEG